MRFSFLVTIASDYSRMLYHDLMNNQSVDFITRQTIANSTIGRVIARFFLSPKLYTYVKVPLRNFFYRRIYNQIKENQSRCVIMTVEWYTPSIVAYLRKKDPNLKLTLMLTDTLESKKRMIRFLSGTMLKKDFNLVLSYNKDDVQKYGFVYFPVHYSIYPNYETIQTLKKWDFVFVGAIRDRRDEIEKIYDLLSENGYKCMFYVLSKRQEVGLHKGIIYSNKKLCYEEYLQFIKSAKCIVEIVNSNTKGNTLRFWESIFYNKCLLTNLPDLENQPMYNSKYMFSIQNIDSSVLNKIVNESDVNYNYNGEMSPEKILSEVEGLLQNENFSKCVDR